MNDKATEKHHWPGPGTTKGQGMWLVPGGSLPAHHPTEKPPGSSPKQEGSFITASKPLLRLFGNPISRSREAKELPEQLGRARIAQAPLTVKAWGCHLS